MTARHRLTARLCGAALILTGATMWLSACSAAGPIAPADRAIADDTQTLLARPDFSGPYAAEFAEAWDESANEFVRSVIADQEISDAEWAELGSRMTSCLAQWGIEFRGFGERGDYTTSPGPLGDDETERVLETCERETGEQWLHLLHLSLRTNPENIASEILITDCMVRNGIVARGYTKDDYLRDVGTMSFPYTASGAGQEGFVRCNDDPTTRL